MKLIKVIAILLIISSSLSAKLRSEEQTSLDNGDYSKTLLCKMAFVASERELSISGDNFSYGSLCRFDAKFIANGKAEGNFEYGIACDFSGNDAQDPNSNDKKYLTHLKDKIWYLPYRNLKYDRSNHYLLQADYNRKLIFPFITDDGVEKQFILRFPYKSFGNYIETGEVRKVAEGIDSIYPGKINSISREKNSFEGNAQKIKDNQPFIAKAKKGEAELKKQVDESKKQLTNQKKSLKDGQSKMKDLKTKYSQALRALEEAKKALSAQDKANSEISGNIDNIESNILTAEGQSNKAAASLKQYEDHEKIFVKDVNSNAQRLKSMTRSQVAHIDAAVTAAKAYNTNDVKANLNKFQPRSWIN